MKFLPLVFLFASFIFTTSIQSQSDYIMLGSRQYNVIDRMELKLRKDSVLNFSAIKPYSRKVITEKLEQIQDLAAAGKIQLSKQDAYNIDIVLKDNFEYRRHFVNDTTITLKNVFSKKSLTNPLYVGVKRGDFSIYATAFLNFGMGNDDRLTNRLFNNTRAVYIRGNITKGISYYSYLSENQERDPLYVQQWVDRFKAVPGEGYYKSGFKGDGYDLFNARGGIMFKAAKNIDVQFAYDKVFIGNGFRSLILSDFSNNQLFLKVNAKIWKFQYHMMFSQLTKTFTPTSDFLRPRKFMAFHQLDFQLNKWLNIGLYENVMFGRGNGFDLTYLNPVIFYRAAEIQNGSPDKVTIGTNIKANVTKNIQLYGQFILNEFVLKEIIDYKKGSSRNKQAIQIGGKAIDVLGIKNLDVQLEANIVRPFVYSHYDTAGSFSHYNQPLAHPLGANFNEFIGIVRYQPINKLQLEVKAIYYKQGLDSAGQNFGSNIFRNYTDISRQNGFFIGSGIPATCLIGSITATYEILPNLFFDANATIRNYSKLGSADFNTKMYTAGLRLNINRRVFDF